MKKTILLFLTFLLRPAYRCLPGFPKFQVHPEWDGNGKPSKTVSYFVLTDSDAGSTLSFKLVNNITVEVSVYPIEEGC